jgi:uncharacterized membrane protein
MRTEHSVQISRPLEEVFAYTSNVDNLPEWAGAVIEVRRSATGQLQEGDRFTTVSKFLGRRFETPQEVTAYEANRRYSYRSTGGPFPLSFTFAFEATPGGTHLTEIAEGEPGTFFRLAGPLLEAAVRRQFKNDLATLKDLMEAQGTE